VLVVVAATPKINPKMDTVPSSMPNTTVPADLTQPLERCSKCHPCFLAAAAPPSIVK
jgi:hypothetical protein